MGRAPEDWFFEELEPVLARCAPNALASLVRRKLQSFASLPPECRYPIAIHALKHLILARGPNASAAKALRLSARESDENNEAIAASNLLKIELLSLPDVQSQFDSLITADLKFIPADFTEILRMPAPEDVDVLIVRYGTRPDKKRHDLIVLLSIHPIAFSDNAWCWLTALAIQIDHELRGLLFKMLTLADAPRFGRLLAASNWAWAPQADELVNDYGTAALIEAEAAVPFDQLAPRLAPWRLLEAARVRGSDPAEVRLAAESLRANTGCRRNSGTRPWINSHSRSRRG